VSVLTTVPADAQARIVQAILRADHPRLALPDIALRHSLTLEEVQTIARRHGYPERAAMVRALKNLDQADTHEYDTAEPDAPPAAEKLLRVPLHQLHPDPKNLRDKLGDITELAESITAVGLLQPIVARRDGDQLIIVAGHRRYAAVTRLGWGSVPVIVRNAMAPDEVLAAMIIENSQRADLDPIEEARGLARLRADHDITSESRLAHMIGRTQNHVSSRLRLLALTPDEQDAVRNGHMTVGAAVEQARINSGRTRPGAQGKKSAAHLSVHHELATKAAGLRIHQGRARGSDWAKPGVSSWRAHLTVGATL